ncbi:MULTISPECIES: chaplin [unclassified Streptomyces]|uniref:chaplin n=1 Tax=unclassified Streptomyces TaxID=2593676 RepID=UPI0022B711EA|nr:MULTISPECIES: chaplin [unclassified Streptomyces]MCZ7413455.1 chaplin [Streptomyces sp. WMMC897]MCZ7430449.1 chaplin [Streptomyces sp. WMMC1477]
MKHVVKATTLAAAGCALIVGGAGSALAHGGPSGASAEGAAVNSPGVLSGNVVQVPIAIPVNVCGNTVNVIGLLNPTFGNTCINK